MGRWCRPPQLRQLTYRRARHMGQGSSWFHFPSQPTSPMPPQSGHLQAVIQLKAGTCDEQTGRSRSQLAVLREMRCHPRSILSYLPTQHSTRLNILQADLEPVGLSWVAAVEEVSWHGRGDL